jgi:lysozyme family protein
MKGNFTKCFQHVLMHEGGYVEHPRDPGGVTNLGVTKATWQLWTKQPVTNEMMRNLTPDLVRPLYLERYWNAIKGDDLPAGLDYSVFDCAVNSGPTQATRFLQREVGTAVDGIIGPLTLKAVKEQDARDLIKRYNAARLRFLQQLPTWTFFGRGWSKRVSEVLDTSLMFTSQE